MGVLAGGVCISSVSLTVNRKYFMTGFLCIIASSVLLDDAAYSWMMQ